MFIHPRGIIEEWMAHHAKHCQSEGHIQIIRWCRWCVPGMLDVEAPRRGMLLYAVCVAITYIHL